MLVVQYAFLVYQNKSSVCGQNVPVPSLQSYLLHSKTKMQACHACYVIVIIWKKARHHDQASFEFIQNKSC